MEFEAGEASAQCTGQNGSYGRTRLGVITGVFCGEMDDSSAGCTCSSGPKSLFHVNFFYSWLQLRAPTYDVTDTSSWLYAHQPGSRGYPFLM